MAAALGGGLGGSVGVDTAKVVGDVGKQLITHLLFRMCRKKHIVYITVSDIYYIAYKVY